MTSTPARSRAISARTFQAIPRSCRRTCRQRAGLAPPTISTTWAAKDGTVIALFQNTVPLEPFFENKQAQFDAAKIGWLGTPTTETALYMLWHGSKIRTLADAQRQEFVAGAGRRRLDARLLWPRIQPDLQFQGPLHHGYPGQNEILLALENGEVEAMGIAVLSSLKTARPGWHKEGKIRFLFQYGSDPHPDLKDVPLALDLLAKSS